jgi:hypothetical protein
MCSLSLARGSHLCPLLGLDAAQQILAEQNFLFIMRESQGKAMWFMSQKNHFISIQKKWVHLHRDLSLIFTYQGIDMRCKVVIKECSLLEPGACGSCL